MNVLIQGEEPGPLVLDVRARDVGRPRPRVRLRVHDAEKKYTVKNEPNSMISDPMKRKIPTIGG